MAMAPVDPELQLVTSADEVRRSVAAFASQASVYPDLARDFIVYAHLWVYDPSTKSYGPSKFVGLRDMNFEKYRNARMLKALDGQFDGHGARLRIEKLVGSAFEVNEDLLSGCSEWLERLVPETGRAVLKGVDTSKWSFVSLPSGAKVTEDWSSDEVAATVVEYFSMLQKELTGDEYSKASHRSHLLKILNGRSGPAVEFKHCNISAVLAEAGLAYIAGYKPRANYHQALVEAVEGYLAADQDILDALETKTLVGAAHDTLADLDWERVFEGPPEVRQVVGRTRHASHASKIDWAARDAANRQLGTTGEGFVAKLERDRLAACQRSDLAARVELVSRSQGDGLGYDIASFEQDGSEKYIEVKTTNGGKSRSFYLSANELCASERLANRYWLYRVFKRDGMRKVFTVRRPLTTVLQLEPVQYRATVSAIPIGGG